MGALCLLWFLSLSLECTGNLEEPGVQEGSAEKRNPLMLG